MDELPVQRRTLIVRAVAGGMKEQAPVSDCGGKRSATPLWSVTFHPTKAPSLLASSLCRRTPTQLLDKHRCGLRREVRDERHAALVRDIPPPKAPSLLASSLCRRTPTQLLDRCTRPVGRSPAGGWMTVCILFRF